MACDSGSSSTTSPHTHSPRRTSTSKMATRAGCAKALAQRAMRSCVAVYGVDCFIYRKITINTSKKQALLRERLLFLLAELRVLALQCLELLQYFGVVLLHTGIITLELIVLADDFLRAERFVLVGINVLAMYPLHGVVL